MSSHPTTLPSITVNARFIDAFVAAPAPSFAIGLAMIEQMTTGFLAICTPEPLPEEVQEIGFNFGHSLLGTHEYEVVHFAFEFYGHHTYSVLLNPSHPIVQAILTTIVGSGDYFFFALHASGSATAFRAVIGQEDIAGLKANFPRILKSRTTDAQYQQALAHFKRKPYPPGTLLNWVCHEDSDYLNLTDDPLVLRPSR